MNGIKLPSGQRISQPVLYDYLVAALRMV